MATGWVLPQFAVGILDGGLPGAGWEPGKPRIRLVPGLINSTK